MRAARLRQFPEGPMAESGTKIRFGQKNPNVEKCDLGICRHSRFVSANFRSNACPNRQFVPDSAFATERSRLRSRASRRR